MLLDFHTHLLPAIDDGSANAEESLAMLRALAAQGVTHVAATPHFYADRTSPERFLQKRENALRTLQPLLSPSLPQILLGAEVYYYEGMDRTRELSALCLSGTRLLLVEMPTERWTRRMITALLSLNSRGDVNVVLAHFERYLHFAPHDVWDILSDNGVLLQANAEFFLQRRTRRTALRLLSKGKIAFLGTDCHNLTDRAPNMASALTLIRRKLGAFSEEFLRMEERLLYESKNAMDSDPLPDFDRGLPDWACSAASAENSHADRP